MHGVLALILAMFLVNQAAAGAWTPNQFVYKPALGARGQTEKSTFDTGLDRVDAHLGKYKTLGDPNHTTLDEALTTIGANEQTLTIPAGTVSITVSKTIPANVHLKVLRGGKFDIANGVTLTINSPFTAGPYQTFSWTGTGKVVFGNGSASELLPEWWGAKPDNSTDCTLPIQKAMDSAPYKTVKFQSGTYLISAPLVFKSHLLGEYGVTYIKAKTGWSGGRMLDFYDATEWRKNLSIRGIAWHANSLVVNIFGSSNDGLGNAQTLIERCEFYYATGYAVAADSATAAEVGIFTGSTWLHCYWAANSGGACYFGRNQDNINMINCWMDNGATQDQLLVISGTNFVWNGGFIMFGNCPDYGGKKALIRIESQRTAEFRNIFFETNGSDITHFFLPVFAQCNLVLDNLYFRVNDTNQSPGLVALVRADVGGSYGARYPQIALRNIYADYDNPTWKLLDLWVGSGTDTDFLTLDISLCDGFDEPWWQYAAGSSSQSRTTLSLTGVHRGKRLNHEFSNAYSTTVPVRQGAWKDHRGLPSDQTIQEIASGNSPRTSTYTLAASGIYLVSVTAKLTTDNNNMANGSWLVYWHNDTNDVLATDQLGTSKFSVGSSLGVNSLTLSAPTQAGVLTASVGWTNGSPYPSYFHWRVKRLSNLNYLGD